MLVQPGHLSFCSAAVAFLAFWTLALDEVTSAPPPPRSFSRFPFLLLVCRMHTPRCHLFPPVPALLLMVAWRDEQVLILRLIALY